MKFLSWLQPLLPQETLRKKDGIGKHQHSSFQKSLGWVVTAKGFRVIAQNVKQGLAWIHCLINFSWQYLLIFFIYKVINITKQCFLYIFLHFSTVSDVTFNHPNIADNIIRKVIKYIVKSVVGQRMEPWGTPTLTGYSCKDFPSRTTWNYLVLRKW